MGCPRAPPEPTAPAPFRYRPLPVRLSTPPIVVRLEELPVGIRHIDLAPLDENGLDVGGVFERAAVCDQEGGVLADLEGPDPVRETEQLGRADGDRPEGLLGGQPQAIAAPAS
jgi:hypothetical protein